eukprot:COSAG06_NODE_49565_length_324_cov_1.288889_1_plen_26_part_10
MSDIGAPELVVAGAGAETHDPSCFSG